MRSITPFIALAGVGVIFGCGEAKLTTPSPDGPAFAHGAGAERAATHQGLATLRRVTARYHDVTAAVADGFEPLLPCMEDPQAGGLGIPYGNLARFDATIDLGQPEVLFYEPQENGRLLLVGAEPVVPIALWPEEDPPSLFGREFHTNADHGLYGLHMWVWRHNPSGVFSFWNPAVSCEFAG